jgi:hypothetical protein
MGDLLQLIKAGWISGDLDDAGIGVPAVLEDGVA